MKEFIRNRKNENICVVVEGSGGPKGLAFVMHGLSGNKDQKHIRTFVQAFLDNNYTVVSFDAVHTYGESGGSPEEATTTNYLEDLEDVIAWAQTQNFYTDPFCLAGHSLGGFASALYAEKHPEQIKALAPISTVVSGTLSSQTKEKGSFEQWKQDGYKITPSSSTPGLMKKINWSEFEDRLRYDLLPEAGKLTMPVFLLTGELDETTPPEHQKILLDTLPGKKELHIIRGAPHTFTTPEQLLEIKTILDSWIKSLH